MSTSVTTPSNNDAAAIKTPTDLVAGLKKSGKFDELRKALWSDFEQSPDKVDFLSRIESIVQSSLERPTFKSKPRKDRQSELMKEVETRHTHLSKVVSEVERSLKAKEREREGEGKKGPIKTELSRILKESKGDHLEDGESSPEGAEAEEVDNKSTASASHSTTPIPSTSTSTLPAPSPGPLLAPSSRTSPPSAASPSPLSVVAIEPTASPVPPIAGFKLPTTPPASLSSEVKTMANDPVAPRMSLVPGMKLEEAEKPLEESKDLIADKAGKSTEVEMKLEG